MLTNRDPRELVIQLLKRSESNVQVAAVIEDGWGIHAWGWNGMGSDGMGIHAEAHAIGRANRNRFENSTIYVSARRKRSGRVVTSKPCLDCQRLIDKWGLRVVYRDGRGIWL